MFQTSVEEVLDINMGSIAFELSFSAFISLLKSICTYFPVALLVKSLYLGAKSLYSGEIL